MHVFTLGLFIVHAFSYNVNCWALHQKTCYFESHLDLKTEKNYSEFDEVECHNNSYKWNLAGLPGDGYYINANIGSPPQSVNLLVDTGSSNLAVAGNYNTVFDTYFKANESSTYVSCSGDPIIKVDYVQGWWEGLLGSDVVVLPSLSCPYVTRANLALITLSHNFYIKGSHWQGILGLAFPELARPNKTVQPWFDSLISTQNIFHSVKFHASTSIAGSGTNSVFSNTSNENFDTVSIVDLGNRTNAHSVRNLVSFSNGDEQNSAEKSVNNAILTESSQFSSDVMSEYVSAKNNTISYNPKYDEVHSIFAEGLEASPTLPDVSNLTRLTGTEFIVAVLKEKDGYFNEDVITATAEHSGIDLLQFLNVVHYSTTAFIPQLFLNVSVTNNSINNELYSDNITINDNVSVIVSSQIDDGRLTDNSSHIAGSNNVSSDETVHFYETLHNSALRSYNQNVFSNDVNNFSLDSDRSTENLSNSNEFVNSSPALSSVTHDAYKSHSQTEENSVTNGFGLELCGAWDTPHHSAHYGRLILGNAIKNCGNGPWFETPILQPWFYEVAVTGMFVAGVSLDLPCTLYNSHVSIVDSGTTKLKLPKQVLEALVAQLDEAVANKLSEPLPPNFWRGNGHVCWTDAHQSWAALPVISIEIALSNSSSFSVEIGPRNYLRPYFNINNNGSPSAQFKDYSTSFLAAGDSRLKMSSFANGMEEDFGQQDWKRTEDDEMNQEPSMNLVPCWESGIDLSNMGTVLGVVVMEGLCVHFDRGRGVLGFRRANCGPSVSLRGPTPHQGAGACIPGSGRTGTLLLACILALLCCPLLAFAGRFFYRRCSGSVRLVAQEPFINLDEAGVS